MVDDEEKVELDGVVGVVMVPREMEEDEAKLEKWRWLPWWR